MIKCKKGKNYLKRENHCASSLVLRYKDKAVPFSIDFTPTEANSAMQAREKQPAE